MAGESEWSQDVYDNSLSSRCWWATSYGAGWEAASNDAELRAIVQVEMELGPVADWAGQIVETSINFVPPCGHHLFPLPQLEVIKAIGSQTPSAMVHGCYTVERERKRQMLDYCLCIDAWLAGASLERVARELADLGYRKINWQAVCKGLWKTLGERSEGKNCLVERVLHHLRWWTKSTIWDDDLGAEFHRDKYLGDHSQSGGMTSQHCHVERRVPHFNQQASPRIKKLEARLDELCPLWKELRPWILEEWWLCAPKAFRFLERILWQIGEGKRVQEGEHVPGFLHAEDTCPSRREASAWWDAFCCALQAWSRGRPEEGKVAGQVNAYLGKPSPVKRWLVALYLRKLRLLETWKLGQLVKPTAGSGWGTNPIRTG